MARHHVPRYVYYKPRDCAAVVIDGKRTCLGPYNSIESKAEYNRIIANWLLSKGKPPTPASPDHVSVDQILYAYWTHAQTYYRKGGKPTGQLHRIKSAFGPLRKLYGTLAASAFGPRELKAVREEMIRLGWCRSRINSLIGCIRRAWRYSCEEEMIPAHLWQGLAVVRNLQRGRSPAPEAPKVTSVPDHIVEATLPELTPIVADMVRLQYLAGMRPLEVCRMKAEDVDRSGRLPDGLPFPGVWVYLCAEDGNKLAHKDVVRVVFLGPKAQAILAPYIARRPQGYLFSPREASERWLEEHGRSPKRGRKREPGDYYPTNSYGHAVSKAARRAGVPAWWPGRLRHSGATAIRRRADLQTASAVLGHQSLETSLVYAEEDLRRAASDMLKSG